MMSPIVSILAGAIFRGGLGLAGQHFGSLLAPKNDSAVQPSALRPPTEEGDV